MIDRTVYFVTVLVTLLTIGLSQECPSGCTCSSNGSNDGTIVTCNGGPEAVLGFHLVHPKIISVTIRNYQNLDTVDLSQHSIAYSSDVQIDSRSVTILDLSYNQLTTAFLQDFASLEMLTNLDLKNNGMTNFGTSNVQRFNSLHEINLQNNNLSNVILNPTVFTRVNFPRLSILLYGNPLECLCDVDNALVEFIPEDTTCVTEDGQTSQLKHYCSSRNNSSSIDVIPTPVVTISSTIFDNITTSSTTITTSESSTPSTTTTNVMPVSSTPSLTRSSTTPTTPPSADTTSTLRDSSMNNDDHIFVTIGAIISAVMAVIIVILFTLILIVYRLRKRFLSHDLNHGAKVTTVSADPENYLSPIRTVASIRGIHYIPESVMRLSQISEAHYEEIDPISDRLGPIPPIPVDNEYSIPDGPKIIPYHVTTIEDIVDEPAEEEQPNQYLDLQA